MGMYLVYLVNQDIPEREKFYDENMMESRYELLLFVQVSHEQEIKQHLCNCETELVNTVYFVLKDNEVFMKSKIRGFRSQYKLNDELFHPNFDEELEIMVDSISLIEISHLDTDSLLDDGKYEWKIVRVYNQEEDNKIRLKYVDYVDADDEKDAYMKELDRDSLSGIFIFVKDNKVFLKTLNKTHQWNMKVKWGHALLERVLDSYELEEEKYEDLKAD